MARIRTIKPEFWTSEQVMECSTNARLLFIGMWNFADDCGRLRLSAKTLKAQIFPADEFDAATVLRMIDELSSNGLLTVYEVNEIKYLQVNGWHHQRIDRPQPARHPAPEQGVPAAVAEAVRRPFVERSTTDLKGRELKGREGSLREGSNPSRIRARALAEPTADAFEEFWKIYPKREGSNPKKPAQDKFDRLVKSGIAPVTIIEGAVAYGRSLSLQGKLGTVYVKQAVTWLNQHGWDDHAAVPDSGLTNSATAGLTPQQAAIKEAMDELANFAAGRGARGGAGDGVLRSGPGGDASRHQGIHGGDGGNVLPLPTARHPAGGRPGERDSGDSGAFEFG